MALSGNLVTTEQQGRSVTLSWTATQNVKENYSTVKWSLKGSGSYSGWVGVSEIRITINGKQEYYRDASNHTDTYQGTELASGSCKIPHNSDGSKTFAIKVEAGIYEWYINTTANRNFTLNALQTASTISWGSGTSFDAGVIDGANIDIKSTNTNYTHTLTYYFGTATGDIAVKTKNKNVKWTIPLDLLYKIPHVLSGEGKIVCTTYNIGSTDSNPTIGKTSLKLTVNVPSSCIPSVTKPVVTVDNSSNATIKSWGLYVEGYSKAKITASASGIYGSSVRSFKITGGYSTTINGSSLSYTGDILSAGTKTFNVSVTDSRGKVSVAKPTEEITVYSYNTPTIPTFMVSRNEDDTSKMTVFTNWNYSSVNGKNVATPILYYKKQYETTWQTYGAVDKNANTTLSVDFSEFDSYNFKLVVTDSVGNSIQKDAFVSTISPLLDFRAGGKGLGIGKASEKDAMEVNMNAEFLKDVYYGEKAKIKLPIIQKGNIVVKPTSANTPTKGHVTFPIPFSNTPCVVITPNSAAVGVKVVGVGVTNVTKEGFDAVLTMTEPYGVGLYWMAMY